MIIRIIECIRKMKSFSISNNKSTKNLLSNPIQDCHPTRNVNVEANKYIRIAV